MASLTDTNSIQEDLFQLHSEYHFRVLEANVYLIIVCFHAHDITCECASMPLGFKFCALEKFTALKHIKTRLTVQDIHALSLATVIAIPALNSVVQQQKGRARAMLASFPSCLPRGLGTRLVQCTMWYASDSM